MEQAVQTFNWTVLVLPVLLALVPTALFAGGYRLSRGDVASPAGKALSWLGWHGVTLVLVAVFTVLRKTFIPDMIVTQLPLLVTVGYLIIGRVFRSPFFFSLGLATPGLWMFLLRLWAAFSGAREMSYVLPEEPFWYLLASVIIFAFLQSPVCSRIFRDDCGAWLVAISGGYLMGGLWLLALGQPSLLSAIGLTLHIWAVILMLVSVFFLWCSQYLRDPLFAVCSGIGFAAGLYSFVAQYPWS